MRGLLLMTVLAGTVLIVVANVAGESRAELARAEYVHTIRPEYLYSTGQVEEKSTEQRRLWDYLSFLSLRKDPDNGHLFEAEEATTLKARVRELSRQLLANAQESIAEEYVITINSFVNLGNLYKTSSLGRYIAEQLIGEMQLAGVEVIDVRKTAGLMIYERHGEYGLSRDMDELSYLHASQAMVVGTYTYAQGQIFLNARLLQNSDGMVLSNASLVFDLDPVTRQMLSDESMPARRGRMVTIEQFEE
nr:hypothetical protein [Desulfobulbaceae bacterium]